MRFTTSVINEGANIRYFFSFQYISMLKRILKNSILLDCNKSCYLQVVKDKFKMRKYILSILIVALSFSCSETIEFNNPAMQGNRDGETWKADYYAADIDFGGFLFEGGRGTEVLQLITPDDSRGIYSLTNESVAVAIFRDAEGTVYSTANLPDPSITIYPPEGIIQVEDIDNSDPKRVTGTFRFTAFTQDGLKSVNFINGVFYRVSLVGGLAAIAD